MTRALWTIALAVALASPAAAAKPKAPEVEDFADTSLAAGLSAGFGLQRLGGSNEALPLAGRLIERPDALIRVLVDPASGSAFGYRLEAATLSSSLFGVIRVDIHALTREDEKEITELKTCAQCPSVRLMGATTRFPPTQLIRAGDTMVVDLLVRPETGEKIVDVVRFSYEAVTKRALDDVRERVRQAFQYVKQGDEEKGRGATEAAAALYAKALALQPDAATYVRLGQCHEKLDKLERAQQDYEQALRRNSGDADTWMRLAVLRHRRGQFGKAANGYERALKIRPDWALAHRNLATAHLDRAQIEAAFREYREAYRRRRMILDAPETASVTARDGALQHYVFAKVYAAEGEIESALSSLQKARDAGFRDLERIREDVEFRPFLDDPRFGTYLANRPRS
jgi:hypothetical protein